MQVMERRDHFYKTKSMVTIECKVPQRALKPLLLQIGTVYIDRSSSLCYLSPVSLPPNPTARTTDRECPSSQIGAQHRHTDHELRFTQSRSTRHMEYMRLDFLDTWKVRLCIHVVIDRNAAVT